MLLSLAIGDAYGAGFEYARGDFIARHNDLKRYYQHPKHLGIKPGMYTDDTQMSLAVAEALLKNPHPSALEWAEHFVSAFHRDRREGYAQRFYDFLLTVRDGSDFLARIKPHSDKSGAAMRTLPVGFLETPEAVLEVAAEQARLTHDTPDGIRSAQAAALSAHYLLRRLGPKAELEQYLEKRIGGPWCNWRGSVGSAGMDSVRAALTSFARHQSMRAMLHECIAWTGDVDTVAALALGLAACCADVEQDLPQVLLDTLENGAFGSDYVKQLDRRLRERFLGG
ncbi:ADP-ribosylglycohydrolase [bacterium SCN 62-11]|nr:ADP-ribosylglycohydrolase family protein [Candidatus Eremiobacteraeota bacterium]ODT56339.1 MAG: ADP-ribosylglycohydrolase [bacterium SCN 62-11]